MLLHIHFSPDKREHRKRDMERERENCDELERSFRLFVRLIETNSYTHIWSVCFPSFLYLILLNYPIPKIPQKMSNCCHIVCVSTHTIAIWRSGSGGERKRKRDQKKRSQSDNAVYKLCTGGFKQKWRRWKNEITCNLRFALPKRGKGKQMLLEIKRYRKYKMRKKNRTTRSREKMCTVPSP